LAALRERCGKDGFHYMIGGPLADEDDSMEMPEEIFDEDDPES